MGTSLRTGGADGRGCADVPGQGTAGGAGAGDRVDGSRPGPGRWAWGRSAADEGQGLVADAGHGGGVACLGVQAEERFGVGGADVEPPVRAGDGESVEFVEGDAVPALVGGPDRGEAGALVVDGGVDLAGAGVAVVLGDQGGQCAVLLAERGEDVQGGQHAGVGVPEVAEVVVGRVLTAEDRAGPGHLGLDEGVADPGADGGAAVFGDDLGHGPGRDQVVDDHAAAAVAGEFARGDEGGDGGRGDGFAPLVDDEAAVGVAVEGEAEVGVLLADPLLEVDEVGRVEGVGLVGGEGAVAVGVHRDEGERQPGEHGGGGVAAHAVAGVDDDLQGADGGQVDEGAQVGRVGVQRVAGADGAGDGRRFGRSVRAPPLDEGADLGETGVLADGGGSRAAQLDPV